MSEHRRSDILFVFALAMFLVVAWHVRGVLTLIYVSALFAVVLGPVITQIRRIRIRSWKPGRGVAVLLLLLVGLSIMVLFSLFAIPPIYRDIQAFAADLPNKTRRLYAYIQHLPGGSDLEVGALQEHATRAVGGIVGVLGEIAGGLFGFFSWLILTIYFTLDGERAFHWFLSLVAPRHRPRLEATLVRAEARMSKWLLGQLSLMLILGTTASIVFLILKVKYAFALGVFCGLANIVPIIGPIVSITLAAVVAVFDSWTKALGVVIFYLVYQQIENAYLTPRIMKSTVDLPALGVIIALSLGGALAGVLGALVAVPTAALIAVIVDEYLVKRPARESSAESRTVVVQSK
jgi:predicted PurR-regulated permease PerM